MSVLSGFRFVLVTCFIFLVSSQTDSPTEFPTNEPTYSSDLTTIEFSADYDHFSIELFVYPQNSTIRLNFKNTDYNNNWFGIVFAHSMIGNAVIFTSGKSTNSRTSALFSYTIDYRSLSNVQYTSSDDWTLIEEAFVDSTVSLSYWTYLSKTDWNINTEEIKLRLAWHSSSLELVKHSEYSAKLTLYAGGGSSSGEDYKTLILIHQLLMWTAWSVLCTFGIMCSAFRNFFEKRPTWLNAHQYLQISAVVLASIAFFIGVIYVTVNDYQHFASVHMILGMAVLLLVVVEPINGIFRPHIERNGENGYRKLWEILHKGLGYCIWFLAQITIFLGLLLINNGEINGWFYFHIVWVSIVIVLYCGLKLMSRKQSNDNSKVVTEFSTEMSGRGIITNNEAM